MTTAPVTKVVLIQTVLPGSHSNLLQDVATVLINEHEFRVCAPTAAKGPALQWISHFSVRRQGGFYSEEDAGATYKELALRLVKQELENQEQETLRADGTHPDGIHCSAQICRNGHIQHCDGMPFDSKTHCTKCGASCIHECPDCREPIRGAQQFQDTTHYSLPQFCHGCGRPYPWMADRLDTARDLLWHDDHLTPEDRENLWKDLKYVMSDPRADLVPAKRKLIEIKLGKAAEVVRVSIIELIAKTMAEVFKG
jgi:hypothetical protein